MSLSAIRTTTLVCPDGAERRVRYSQGAKRRITERFGGLSIQQILSEHGDAALASLVYACLYDEEGKPPADLTLAQFEEMLPGDSTNELFATLAETMSQGAARKNEVEALLQEAESRRTGSTPGASGGSVSDSATESSGGSLTQSSRPSANDTASSSGEPTAESG